MIVFIGSIVQNPGNHPTSYWHQKISPTVALKQTPFVAVRTIAASSSACTVAQPTVVAAVVTTAQKQNTRKLQIHSGALHSVS